MSLTPSQLKEKLAAIEHDRWSKWQKYMHSVCNKNADGSLTIPAEKVKHWERQIATPYEKLSHFEQKSDMDEVDKYWPLIKVTEDTSDGYHTFKELYEFRRLYNAALFNEWAEQDKYNVHKSYKHSDGELCFGGGWFVVVAELPTGQITNHYENKYWNEFKIPIKGRANIWDGHTAADTASRLQSLIKNG